MFPSVIMAGGIFVRSVAVVKLLVHHVDVDFHDVHHRGHVLHNFDRVPRINLKKLAEAL